MDCIFQLIQRLPGSFYEGEIKLNVDTKRLEEISTMNLVLRIPIRSDIFSTSYQSHLKEFDAFFELQFIYLYCSFYEQYQILKKASDEKIIEACKYTLKDLYELLKKYKKEGDVENEKKIQYEISNILQQNKNIHQSRQLFDKFNIEVENYRKSVYQSLQMVYQIYKSKIQKTLKSILSFEVFEKTILDIMKEFSRLMIEYFEEYLVGIKDRKSFWCNCQTCLEEKREKNEYKNQKMMTIQNELETLYSLIQLYHSSLFLNDS
jgi:hypothetical protein